MALLRRAEIPLEAVILLVAALALVVAGALLFAVAAGSVAFYEGGLYGLLLVIFSLQMIALGKTPFGDLRRSRVPLVAGVIVAAVGIVTVFVPDALGDVPRILLFVCFCPGGVALLLQTVLGRDKLRAWAGYGGVFRHLIASTMAVYLLSIAFGVLFLFPAVLTTWTTALVAVLLGATLGYLAVVLRVVYLRYPESEGPADAASPSIDRSTLLLMGIFMVLLGVLLVPVNLGKLPFSGSAQLGLLMVVLAVQMVSAGSTPVGAFTRSWPLVALGMVFAALGVVSCIVPDVLVPFLTVLIGVLNIAGGLIGLARALAPRLKRAEGPREAEPSALRKLFAANMIMNTLTILFGTSMLVSGLLPGLVLGVVLAANGCVLLYLVHVLGLLDRLQTQTPEAHAPEAAGAT